MSITAVKATPSADGTQVTVTWKNSSPGNAQIVKIKSDPSHSWQDAAAIELAGTARSCTIKGTTPGAGYTVQVNNVQFGSNASAAFKAPKPAPPTPPGLMLGIGAISIDGGNPAQLALQATMRHDRIDVGDGTDLSQIEASITAGFEPFVLLNPGNGPSGGAGDLTASQIATFAGTLAAGLKAIDATRVWRIGIINEPYLIGNGPSANGGILTPATYAGIFATARAAIKAVLLSAVCVAQVTGDYPTSTPGKWVSEPGGCAWMRDMVQSLGDVGLVDAWDCHPYAPDGGNPIAAFSANVGWLAVGNYIAKATALGSTAPFYVTEVGIKASLVGGDATKAQLLARILSSLLVADAGIAGTPYTQIKGLWVYRDKDDGSGDYGLFDGDTPRQSGETVLGFAKLHAGVLA